MLEGLSALRELLPSPADGACVIALKIGLLVLFAALGLAFAVWVALRRDPWIGLRARHPRPDPLSDVHGDIPTLDFFSAAAPSRNRSRHPHNPAGHASGGEEAGGCIIPSCGPAGRSIFGDGDFR